MRQLSSVNWKIVTCAAAMTFVAAATEPGRANSVNGQAKVAQSTMFTPLGGISSVSLADTGTLSDATDARHASQSTGAIPSVFSGETLHATAIGWPDQVASEASVAGVSLSIAGVAIEADFVMSRAKATAGAAPAGASSIEGLSLGGIPIDVTGAPNQTIAIVGGRLIINEHQASPSGLTVNALHLIVDGVADVVVASASAGIR